MPIVHNYMILKAIYKTVASSLGLLAACQALAQPGLPPVSPDIERAMERISKHAPVVKAIEAIKASSVPMFEEQLRINERPEPSII